MKKMIPVTSSIFCMILLLCLQDQVITGCLAGIELWYNHVVPALFPFMIMTGILISCNLTQILSPELFVIVIGFLCGFPMGAKTIGQLVSKGELSHQKGEYLLSFCNNVSPMFITGVVLRNYVPDKTIHFPLLFILYLSPIMCAFLFRIYYGKNSKNTNLIQPQDNFTSFDSLIMNALESIQKVGIYIMVFSILIQICSHVLPNSTSSTLLLSTLEITNGLDLISNASISSISRYVLLSGLTSFGGLCSIFQTKAMLSDTNISIIPYTIEKLITALVTSLMTFSYFMLFGH